MEVTTVGAKVGDRIVIDSEKVGKPAREGEILKVYDSAISLHVLVRWQDGHESDIRPAGGNAQIVPAKGKAKARA